MAQSVGQFLINHHIPKQFQIGPNSSSKDIGKALEVWAKTDPQTYSDNIPVIKRISDRISMNEGFSIGMDDIEPMKKEHDIIFKKYAPKIDRTSSIATKKKLIAEAINEGINLVKKNKGSMGEMVNTGARGNNAQLMKNVLSPIAAKEMDGTPYPYLISKNFSEGLTPAGYWTYAIESRNNTIDTKTQTAEPGDFGKQMFNALNTMVVTVKDCGTDNGIYMKLNDNNIIDRYMAKNVPGVGSRNTLITFKTVQAAKKKQLNELLARSPMTCEARNGICQMCYGLNASGKQHSLGSNVGTLAAQSLSEPLTQMALSSKHDVGLSGPVLEDIGMKGVRKLLTKPKIFPNKAALSQIDGTVDRISPAPQGGQYVYVNGMEHYVPINNEVIVKKGSSVKKGDSLSSGLKDPREFTNLRGLGSGRSYLISALYNAYNPMDTKGNRTGIPIDKRHLEVLAKKDLNHVVVQNQSDIFSKGDIVDYNKLKDYLIKSRQEVSVKDSIGENLGKEYLHYTVGTKITPHMADTLRSRGINKVMITKRNIEFTPHVTNIRQIPLLKDNFLARMTHHEIKNSIINAATLGEKSEIRGYDPIPAFIRGVEFGEGPNGEY